MKKIKYLIAIILICILVFVGIEVFREVEHKENENTNITTGASEEKTNVEIDKLTNGEELMQKAEKTLSARGWAGASNNVIGLKDEIIYYYNKATGEFYPIAEGVYDIYMKTEYAEEITVKKRENFKEYKKAPEFVLYE